MQPFFRLVLQWQSVVWRVFDFVVEVRIRHDRGWKVVDLAVTGALLKYLQSQHRPKHTCRQVVDLYDCVSKHVEEGRGKSERMLVR